MVGWEGKSRVGHRMAVTIVKDRDDDRCDNSDRDSKGDSCGNGNNDGDDNDNDSSRSNQHSDN